MPSRAPSSAFFFFLMIRRPPRSTPLSLHDALPISRVEAPAALGRYWGGGPASMAEKSDKAKGEKRFDIEALFAFGDRKSTRLNSSHGYISYAVFCLKQKNTINPHAHRTADRLTYIN